MFVVLKYLFSIIVSFFFDLGLTLNKVFYYIMVKAFCFDRSSEARCLRRSDLINTLYNALPPNVVKFGHQIVSVKLDPQTNNPILQLQDGNSLSSKVLTRYISIMHYSNWYLYIFLQQ